MKVAIIVITVFVVLGVVETIWFLVRAGMEDAINQAHSWEENPDKAESEEKKHEKF